MGAHHAGTGSDLPWTFPGSGMFGDQFASSAGGLFDLMQDANAASALAAGRSVFEHHAQDPHDGFNA